MRSDNLKCLPNWKWTRSICAKGLLCTAPPGFSFSIAGKKNGSASLGENDLSASEATLVGFTRSESERTRA